MATTFPGVTDQPRSIILTVCDMATAQVHMMPGESEGGEESLWSETLEPMLNNHVGVLSNHALTNFGHTENSLSAWVQNHFVSQPQNPLAPIAVPIHGWIMEFIGRVRAFLKGRGVSHEEDVQRILFGPTAPTRDLKTLFPREMGITNAQEITRDANREGPRLTIVLGRSFYHWTESDIREYSLNPQHLGPLRTNFMSKIYRYVFNMLNYLCASTWLFSLSFKLMRAGAEGKTGNGLVEFMEQDVQLWLFKYNQAYKHFFLLSLVFLRQKTPRSHQSAITLSRVCAPRESRISDTELLDFANDLLRNYLIPLLTILPVANYENGRQIFPFIYLIDQPADVPGDERTYYYEHVVLTNMSTTVLDTLYSKCLRADSEWINWYTRSIARYDSDNQRIIQDNLKLRVPDMTTLAYLDSDWSALLPDGFQARSDAAFWTMYFLLRMPTVLGLLLETPTSINKRSAHSFMSGCMRVWRGRLTARTRCVLDVMDQAQEVVVRNVGVASTSVLPSLLLSPSVAIHGGQLAPHPTSVLGKVEARRWCDNVVMSLMTWTTFITTIICTWLIIQVVRLKDKTANTVFRYGRTILSLVSALLLTIVVYRLEMSWWHSILIPPWQTATWVVLTICNIVLWAYTAYYEARAIRRDSGRQRWLRGVVVALLLIVMVMNTVLPLSLHRQSTVYKRYILTSWRAQVSAS